MPYATKGNEWVGFDNQQSFGIKVTYDILALKSLFTEGNTNIFFFFVWIFFLNGFGLRPWPIAVIFCINV